MYTFKYFNITLAASKKSVSNGELYVWSVKNKVVEVLQEMIHTELGNKGNAKLLFERLTSAAETWHQVLVNDAASFAENPNIETVYMKGGDKKLLKSIDPATKQFWRFALYARRIEAAADVPGVESRAFDTLIRTVEYRLRMAVTLLITVVFDLQMEREYSHFIRLLEGKDQGIFSFPSIRYQGKNVRRTRKIRHIPLIVPAAPNYFLDPIALPVQQHPGQDTGSDSDDMPDTEPGCRTHDGKWIAKKGRRASRSAQANTGLEDSVKIKDLPFEAEEAEESSMFGHGEEDDMPGTAGIAPIKNTTRVTRSTTATAAISSKKTAPATELAEDASSGTTLQGRKRDLDDTGAKDKDDVKRRRQGVDEVSVTANEPSGSNNQSMAAGAGNGKAKGVTGRIRKKGTAVRMPKAKRTGESVAE
ncbi:hypothetical protein LTR17_024918 [Elasticomyces elasticus]|nr:hypothetical protein LTR17_024918 [Elasticomyces elasticus]